MAPAARAVPGAAIGACAVPGEGDRAGHRLAHQRGARGARRELVGVLSGPNLSAEILQRRPCGSVIAAPTQDLAHLLAGWCHAPYLRAYTSTDVVGVEIAGAVKNVIAIAVGAATGLGHG